VHIAEKFHAEDGVGARPQPAPCCLLERQILTKEEAGGRSTGYRLQLPK